MATAQMRRSGLAEVRTLVWGRLGQIWLPGKSQAHLPSRIPRGSNHSWLLDRKEHMHHH